MPEKISFSCSCGQKLNVNKSSLGKMFTCPACLSPVLAAVPTSIEPGSQTFVRKRSQAELTRFNTMRHIAIWCSVAVYILVFEASSRAKPPTMWWSLEFASIIELCVAGAWFFGTKTKWSIKYFICAGIAIGFSIGIWRHQTATYRDRWSKGDVLYSDKYNRHEEIVYRFWSEDGTRSEGPMTSTHKPHGYWETVHIGDSIIELDRWYWYGDEVSEGEWNLRNKD